VVAVYSKKLPAIARTPASLAGRVEG